MALQGRGWAVTQGRKNLITGETPFGRDPSLMGETPHGRDPSRVTPLPGLMGNNFLPCRLATLDGRAYVKADRQGSSLGYVWVTATLTTKALSKKIREIKRESCRECEC